MTPYRRTLTISVAVLGVAGLVAASVPFIDSLKPSARAEAERQAWETPPMPDLVPGKVVVREGAKSRRQEYMNGSWSPIWGQRDLLIRDYDGIYYHYRLPTWEDTVVMPGVFWWQAEGTCKDFGPKTKSGLLLAGTTIQCNDPDATSWPSNSAKWSIDGKSLVEPFPDLPRLRCREIDSGQRECILK